MSKIAVVVAMESEFGLVSNILENAVGSTINGQPVMRGILSGHEVVLLKSGIGKVNAAVQISELIARETPDYVINSGVAGGIGDGLKPGDIVVGEEVCYHDVWCGEGEWGQVQGLPLKFGCSEKLLQTARQIGGANMRFGLICTGDQFVSEIAALQIIKQHFPDGLAVDMESAAIAHVCHLRDVQFMSIRVVSDTPGMVYDNTAQYFDFFTDAPRMTFDVLRNLIGKL